MKKYSLVLEGGGAKGAYQIGAYKALSENGYTFDTIIGTSIGAINAAFLVQGDLKKIEELWKTLSFKDIMDINGEVVDNILSKQVSLTVLKELKRSVSRALAQKGIDTEYMRNILLEYIDEDKIRSSDIRFGLVTFCVTDLKPQKVFIEDIPKGKLVDYLLASSNLPVFKRIKIEEKNFIDGGAFDNCSVQMLYDEGYKNIIAIRLHRRNRIRNYSYLSKQKDLKLKMIVPSVELPNILNFTNNALNNGLKFGYIDCIKQIKKLDGNYYTFEKIDKNLIENIKLKFTPLICLDIVKASGVRYKVNENIIEVCFNRALPKINKYITSNVSTSFKKQIINIVEYVARKEKMNLNKMYNFEEFLSEVKLKAKDKKRFKGNDKIIYYIISII